MSKCLVIKHYRQEKTTGAPQMNNVIALILAEFGFRMRLNDTDGMANSKDPDQSLTIVRSDVSFPIQYTFSGSNTDGSFTTAISNLFLSPLEKIQLMQIRYNLG